MNTYDWSSPLPEEEEGTTNWFSPEKTPAHIGWYEVAAPRDVGLSYMNYWDGKYWRLNKIEYPASECSHNGGFGRRRAKQKTRWWWRGLTESAYHLG